MVNELELWVVTADGMAVHELLLLLGRHQRTMAVDSGGGQWMLKGRGEGGDMAR